MLGLKKVKQKTFEEFFDTTIKLDYVKEKLKWFLSDKFHIPNRNLIKPGLVTIDRGEI